ELAQKGRLEALGGAAYLSHLVAQVPTSVHIEHYAQIVNRLRLMRRLIEAGGQITAIGYEAGPDPDAALGRAEDILYGLRRGQEQRDFVHIREVLDKYFEDSSLAPRRDGYLPHIPTDFIDMDKILGGLQRSDMVVLAARPSLGKTSLALNIARNAAVGHGAKVAIFSLEMSRMDLAYRLLASESGVDIQRVRLDDLTEMQRDAVVNATGVLSESSIWVDDSPMLRDTDMRSKARRLHHEKGLDLIVVDYIQLIRTNRPFDSPVQRMTEISYAVKSLARELDVPVLAVSQLSRAVEARSPKTPMLSDLRESGSIEQDADVVMFIYRDDYYYTEEEWERQNPGEPYPRGVAQIIVAKHRNGPTGRITLHFTEKKTRFENFRQVEE
ncbi:MAG: replicative DNA helicase, partial [Chloroflexota bacterium]|nr:replicative DNA helicase [Chloroflexota bacterium]